MCDTIVALKNATKDGVTLFGKNSDRSPNEPLLLVKHPPIDNDLTKKDAIKLTYIQFPQAAHTYGVVLFKPSWTWGAEMGFNEFGVNIGNEAVFTFTKSKEPSLIGMDIVRLALERTKTAREAVNYISQIISEYGQGGNCGYDHEFYYDNSFLIADSKEAYVLETAGKFYAGKKIKDYYAISNCLSIEKDYDIIHPDAIKNAVNMRKCAGKEDFSFKKAYSDQIFTYFSKAEKRRKSSMSVLESKNGEITEDDIKLILRGHAGGKGEKPWKASVGSVCMHAGSVIGDQTTGSYYGIIDSTKQTYFTTAGSLPCILPYKPLFYDVEAEIPTASDLSAKNHWLFNERVVRYILSGQIDYESFRENARALEDKFNEQIKTAENQEQKREITKKAWEELDEFFYQCLFSLQNIPYLFCKGSPYYRYYWKKKTELLLKEIKSSEQD